MEVNKEVKTTSRFCAVCFKKKPDWRKSNKTCCKKCANAWSWVSKKQRKEAIEICNSLDKTV